MYCVPVLEQTKKGISTKVNSVCVLYSVGHVIGLLMLLYCYLYSRFETWPRNV